MTNPDGPKVPVFQEYMNPLLEVLRREGRPLSNDELEAQIVAQMKLSHAVAAFPHDPENPGRTEVGYRIAWARTYLKKRGLIDNPVRGTWAITEQGRTAGDLDFSGALEVIHFAA